MKLHKIRKAVIPAAGLGTRMLPATKAIPKEMLPVFDKPLIHYAVQELFDAGIEAIMIVTGLGKHVIENHFAQDSALEQELTNNNKNTILQQLRKNLPQEGSIAFTRQSQRLGLGHAVWCARKWIGDEPFFVSTPDELLISNISCVKQMLNIYQQIEKPNATLMAAIELDKSQTKHYGVLAPKQKPIANIPFSVEKLVEKPNPENAPSNFCSIGRYILPAKIINSIESDINKSKNNQRNGEIQLTDAIASSINKNEVYGCLYQGERYDCGKIGGWIAANVAIASKNSANNKNKSHWQHTIQELVNLEKK